jgi:hypothetical protein
MAIERNAFQKVRRGTHLVQPWRKSRTGVRTPIIESGKLLADILMHPFS